MEKKDKKAFLAQSLNVGKSPVESKKSEFRSIQITQNTMNMINNLRQRNLDPTCAVVNYIIKDFDTKTLQEDDFVDDMYSVHKVIMIWITTRELMRIKCAEIAIAYGGRVVSVDKLIQMALRQYLLNNPDTK